jgi:hypothetical protein
MPIEAGSLGRRPPTDFTHVERYPLTAAPTLLKPTPVVIGVNWYAAFDDPQQDSSGRYWIARGYRPGGSLGRIRGGHCVCLKPKGVNDSVRRQVFYDQGVRRVMCRVRHQPHDDHPQRRQALPGALAVGQGQGGRRVGRDQSRRRRGDLRARRAGRPAHARPRALARQLRGPGTADRLAAPRPARGLAGGGDPGQPLGDVDPGRAQRPRLRRVRLRRRPQLVGQELAIDRPHAGHRARAPALRRTGRSGSSPTARTSPGPAD